MQFPKHLQRKIILNRLPAALMNVLHLEWRFVQMFLDLFDITAIINYEGLIDVLGEKFPRQTHKKFMFQCIKCKYLPKETLLFFFFSFNFNRAMGTKLFWYCMYIHWYPWNPMILKSWLLETENAAFIGLTLMAGVCNVALLLFTNLQLISTWQGHTSGIGEAWKKLYT